MSKAQAPQEREVEKVGVSSDRLHAAVSEIKGRLSEVAPHGYDIQRLEDMTVQVVRTGYNLSKCSMRSLQGALFHCARLGLYPGDRQQCFLLARNLKNGGYVVQFQMGYQGYLELARRSGEIEKIEARVVHENDDFAWEYGTSPFIRHVGNLNPTEEKFKACYAVAKLSGVDEKQFVVMVPYEIAKIRSCAIMNAQSPWIKWEASMWRKSAIIQLCKLLPTSTELAYAISRDQEADAGITQPNPLANRDDHRDTPEDILNDDSE